MARHRFKARKSRGFFKKVFRRGHSKGGEGITSMLMGAAIYGAGRDYAANIIQPVSDMVPMGIGDEVLLGSASYLLSKNSNGILKSVGKAGVYIETARVVNALVSGNNKPSASAYSNNAGGFSW